MMKIYTYPARKEWPALLNRPATDPASLEKPVRKILQKVKKNGDKAVLKYTRSLDAVRLQSLIVKEQEIEAAASQLSDQLKNAIQQAKTTIEKFHAAQVEDVKKIETLPGITCWRRSVAIGKVGLYIPGGSAPLFSTVLMLAVPARLAGCQGIILCTPPSKDGSIHPAILYSAALCGISRIYKAGGVQAIGAMAYGTESIPKVFKIFGPGNQYVTAAKQLVQRDGTAIDMPAGPSEVLVIADETAVPEFVAADLLSQAEHGPDSQVILLTTGESIAEKVRKAVDEQIAVLPRKKIARRALQNSRIIVLRDISEAIAFSDLYSPEHLILCCENAEETAASVQSAGSVFIGNYSPESAGDYASGTNHTLPTNGYAAMYSGVSTDSFVKKITYQQLTRAGLEKIAETVMTMAAAEGLEAHKKAVSIRLKQ